MPLIVQKVNREDVIRNVKEVVDNNAASQIVDLRLEAGGLLKFVTDGGDELVVDLSAYLLLREEGATLLDPPPAVEGRPGPLEIVSEAEAKAGLDDTKAMTALKVAQVLEALEEAQFQEETFDKVAKRGAANEIGWTDQLIKLMGGLWLDKILPLPPDKTAYGLVWDSLGKKVYYGTAPAAPAPSVLALIDLTFGTHYETQLLNASPPFTVPAGTPPLIGDSRYSGSLDVGSCDIVSGWAKKRDDLGATVQIDIYRNGVKHTTVLANESRTDVADAIKSTDATYCGFHYDVQDSDRTGIPITWAAKIAGTNYELAKSPYTSNACGIVQTTVFRTYPEGPAELTEGGATGQYVLKQQLSNGQIRTVQPSSYNLSTNIPGIVISNTGVLTPGNGTSVIVNTITVGVRLVLGSNVYELPVRILNQDPAVTPVIISPYPDVLITGAGAQSFSTDGTFPNPFNVNATGGAGEPLPAGITWNAGNETITIASDFPNGAFAVLLTATDNIGNVITDAFLVTVLRQVTPTRTLVSTGIVGPRFMNEGSGGHLFRLRKNYSDGSVDDITSIAHKSLEGWRDGDMITNEGTVSIPSNTVQGDSRPLVVVMVANGVRYSFDTNVIDLSQASSQNPPGTEACVNYGRLTQAQFDAMSQIVVYAYVDMQTPSGQLSYTVRPFVSQAEATLLLPGKGQPGSVVGFSFNRVSSAAAGVGTTLYNDTRPDHILAGTAPYWPVEAGFYALNLTLPSGGNNGSYTLLQTNGCGVITARTENIPLIAN